MRAGELSRALYHPPARHSNLLKGAALSGVVSGDAEMGRGVIDVVDGASPPE
ncbi:MAG: hypothetical protein ACYTG0_36340 [Planctomycetota bacterium]